MHGWRYLRHCWNSCFCVHRSDAWPCLKKCHIMRVYQPQFLWKVWGFKSGVLIGCMYHSELVFFLVGFAFSLHFLETSVCSWFPSNNRTWMSFAIVMFILSVVCNYQTLPCRKEHSRKELLWIEKKSIAYTFKEATL